MRGRHGKHPEWIPSFNGQDGRYEAVEEWRVKSEVEMVRYLRSEVVGDAKILVHAPG